MSANDSQVAGSHYRKRLPQPWDVTAAWDLCFFLGNVIKYVARYREKGGIESLKKARHYLDKKIELLEQNAPAAATPTEQSSILQQDPNCECGFCRATRGDRG